MQEDSTAARYALGLCHRVSPGTEFSQCWALTASRSDWKVSVLVLIATADLITCPDCPAQLAVLLVNDIRCSEVTILVSRKPGVELIQSRARN